MQHPSQGGKEKQDPFTTHSKRTDMKITVRSFARFRELFGAEQTIETTGMAAPVAVLHALCNTEGNRDALFDSEGRLHPHITIMLNKTRLSPGEPEEIPLKDGDELVVYPPVSGG